MVKFLVMMILSLAIAVGGMTPRALASDLANGAKVFSANCAACHTGGLNVVMPMKSLKKEALEKYGMNSAEAIISQVINGKGAMPKFSGRLTEAQWADVADYVLAQAEKGW